MENCIICNGKGQYIMRNPHTFRYESVSSPHLATRFSHKNARAIIKNRKSNVRWIGDEGYFIRNEETKNEFVVDPLSLSKENIFGDDHINDEFTSEIISEADNIMKCIGFDELQLKKYKTKLNETISHIDSALSDVLHAVENKKVSAEKRSKIFGIIQDLRERHTKTKLCIRYVDCMEEAIKENLTLTQLKQKVTENETGEYKARTEYYKIICDILSEKTRKS